jgi:hypothetical protein
VETSEDFALLGEESFESSGEEGVSHREGGEKKVFEATADLRRKGSLEKGLLLAKASLSKQQCDLALRTVLPTATPAETVYEIRIAYKDSAAAHIRGLPKLGYR